MAPQRPSARDVGARGRDLLAQQPAVEGERAVELPERAGPGSPRSCRPRASCAASSAPVVGVDVHVAVGEVAGPHPAAGAARVQARRGCAPGSSVMAPRAPPPRRSSRAAPPSATHTSPMQMSSRADVEATPARPTAARMRPQLGSPPWSAVLTSGDSATVRAMRSASAAVRAPSTRTSAMRVAPSPSRTIISREVARGLGERVAERVVVARPRASMGGAPARAAGQHHRHVVGRGVAVHRDAVEALARRPRAGRGAAAAGATAASVVKKASMVAMLGAIMPAPLAMPADPRGSAPPTRELDDDLLRAACRWS